MAKLSALYAQALFELASERGALTEVLEQAVFLRGELEKCRSVLIHPQIPANEKRGMFSTALKDVDGALIGLLSLAIDKNRESHIIPALTAFIDMAEAAQNKTTAHVVSAVKLDAAQTAALKTLIEKKLGKTVTISAKTDPSVIGGPYLQVDGIFIDRTVKNRLRDLTVSMKERCGA